MLLQLPANAGKVHQVCVHGSGLFAKKDEGIAVDELADMLKNAGWLEQDADSSTLVEMLKSKKRPKGRKAGKGGSALRQDVVFVEQKLAEDVAAWKKTVDDFLSGTLNPRKSVTMLSQTPLVLSLLGAQMELPVTTDYAKLKKILKEKHKLPESVLKQVPGAMADPIMIFDSATMKGDFVMMLDLKDDAGTTVVVPVSLNYDGIGGYTVNYVPSVYAQKSTETNKPRDAWFRTQIEEGRLRYISNKKSREWAKSSGLQLPRVGSHPINGKIKILTEADLVKLEEQNSTLYQFVGEAGAARLDR